MKKFAIVVSALALTSTLAACGSSGAPFGSGEDAIDAFVSAANDGDIDALCAAFGDNESGKAFAEGSEDLEDCVGRYGPIPSGLDLGEFKDEADDAEEFHAEWGEVNATAEKTERGWVLTGADWD